MLAVGRACCGTVGTSRTTLGTLVYEDLELVLDLFLLLDAIHGLTACFSNNTSVIVRASVFKAHTTQATTQRAASHT